MTPLFVAALEEETTAFVPEAPVLHVGVGKVQAAVGLAHHLAELTDPPHLIVNLGTAGGLRAQPIGSVVEVAVVHQHDFDRDTASSFVGRELAGGPLRLDAPPGTVARLATGDRIVTDDVDRRRLAVDADLVDMEGYAIAAVAARFGVPVRIVKVVSDSADEGARTSWAETLRHGSERLVAWARGEGLLPIDGSERVGD
jgi:adenosylhomocysteine nucleosidase